MPSAAILLPIRQGSGTTSDLQTVGGKALSLLKLTEFGLTVPAGFIVPTLAFENVRQKLAFDEHLARFHREVTQNNQLLKVNQLSRVLTNLVLSEPLDVSLATAIADAAQTLSAPALAVRSSATMEDGKSHSFAGEFETFLGIPASDVVQYVVKCWASLYSPRALMYFLDANLDVKDASMAVVIQGLVPGEVSGVAFSAHPISLSQEDIVIEAVEGLGEVSVSGHATPDRYVVNKADRSVIKERGRQQDRALVMTEEGTVMVRRVTHPNNLLTPDQARELARLVSSIEDSSGTPVDVEWTLLGDTFHILQSRPITTLYPSDVPANRFQLLKLVDWTYYVERGYPLFFISGYAHVQGTLFEHVSGFSFSNQMYSSKSGWTTFYRSAVEIQASNIHFGRIIDDEPDLLVKWAEKAAEHNRHAEEMISQYADVVPDAFIRDNFDNIMALYYNIFLYSAVLPYRILVALNNVTGFSSANYEIYRERIELFTQFRSKTHYPFIIRNVFSQIWRAAAGMHPDASPDLFAFATPQELKRLFSVGEIINLDLLRLREKGCTFWREADDNLSFSYDRAFSNKLGLPSQHVDLHLDEFDGDTLEMVGDVACQGSVSGRARVINRVEDAVEFQEGEILVTINANPEISRVLNICAGIVTDEGGLMCHAAVIARELGKPCIVGLNNVTKIAEDGDVIYILDGGRVRIVKEVAPSA